MPKIAIDHDWVTFQAEEGIEEKSMQDMWNEFIEALTHPFTVAFFLLFGVGAPIIGDILWKLEQ